MLRLGVVVLGVVALVVLSEGRASLHHPESPMAIPVNAKGEPQPLPFDEFARRRLVLMNMGNPKWPLEQPDPNDSTKKFKTDRGVVKDRIDKLKRLPNRTPEQSVALAVDLLRFGQPDEADATLVGMRRGFLPNITLVHIAIAQNTREQPTWARANDFLEIANSERPPNTFPGLTPEQLAWQLNLNRGPLLKLVRLRWDESKRRPSPEDELPDAIFPANFANVSNGVLAPAELAKLPPDALATVQQLVLWFPHDPRLYWLLAEIYATKGEFAAARKIMDECAWSLQYGNRKVFMQHRDAVTKAANEKGVAPDEPILTKPDDVPPPEFPLTMDAVWLYFGAVAVIALFALVRAVTKRKKNIIG